MTTEDRVVTTDFLVQLNQLGDQDELQLGPGVLNRLEMDAFHILVPVGATQGQADFKIVCEAQLAVGQDEPLVKEVLVSPVTFESLPNAFTVLKKAIELLPMTVSELDGDLEALLGGDVDDCHEDELLIDDADE